MNRNSLIALGAAAVLAACAADTKQPAADASLTKDLSLASQIRTNAPPTLNDVPPQTKTVEQPRAPERLPATPSVRPAPPPPTPPPPPPTVSRPSVEPVVAPVAPATAAPAPAPVMAREVAAGSTLTAATGARICTTTARPGDKIIATLASSVTGTNGAVIPVGSPVVLEVATVTPGDTPDKATIGFRLLAVVVNNTSYPVTGDVTPMAPFEREKIESTPNSDRRKVIGGAIAGAIAGRVLGGNAKGAVIGAAAGAATGAVVAGANTKYQGCLAEGAAIKIVLQGKIAFGA